MSLPQQRDIGGFDRRNMEQVRRMFTSFIFIVVGQRQQTVGSCCQFSRSCSLRQCLPVRQVA